MGEAIISRRGGGGDALVEFDNYLTSLDKPVVMKVVEFLYSREYLAATTVGDYALFGGGATGSSPRVYVDAYNASLTRTTPTGLSVARYGLVATTVGNYALFGGGYDSGVKATTDAYDTSLTRTIPTALSVARQFLVATTVGNYALFGGGSPGGDWVDAYDTSLTRTNPTKLSVARQLLAATTVGNYALFGGGEDWARVDAYDTSLTRTTPTELSEPRRRLAATTVGNYALFGGGYSVLYSSCRATVDAISTILPNNSIPITAGSKYNFGDGEQTADSSGVLTVPAPSTGYIKYKKGVISQ